MDVLSPVFGGMKTLSQFATPWLLPKLCAARIQNPLDHSNLNQRTVIVKGAYRWTFGLRFELFHQQGNKYWPQGAPVFNPKHKTWEGEVDIGNTIGQESTIVLAIISDDVSIMVSYFSHVFSETKKWVPFIMNTLPKGFTEVDRIVVTQMGKK